MSRHIVPPGIRLSPYLRNFVVGSYHHAENHIPALPFPRLVAFTQGEVKFVTVHGELMQATPAPTAFIVGPSLVPGRYIAPGARYISCSFRAGCLNQFFDVPLDELNHQRVPLEYFVPAWQKDALLERLCAAQEVERLVEIMQEFLIGADAAKRKRRHHLLPMLSTEHLLMPTVDIARITELSVRQFERRFLANYGMPLRDYRRVLRFVNSLGLVLTTQPQEKGLVTRIAYDGGYFDQTHFIRDFREFVGESPGEFIKKHLAGSPAYQNLKLDQREVSTFVDK